jgi:hypothetical protein
MSWMSKMWPKGPRSRVELLKAGASFLTVLIPVLEKWQTVLPVSPQVRQQCLVIAVCVCVLAVIAGYSTGRHTPNGLWVGWCFLLLFLALLTAQLADLQRLEWAERPLYVLVFGFFSLSTSAFLAYSARRRAMSLESWGESSMR